IAEAKNLLNSTLSEAPQQDISDLQVALKQLPEKFNDQEISLGLVGSYKTGKTTLKTLLKAEKIDNKVNWLETNHYNTSSDLVLFLVTGDLSESQWKIIQQLNQNYQRCLIIFNKQDQYIPEEKALILQQIQERVKSIIPANDVIAINSANTSLTVRQHQANGLIEEWIEDQPPKIQPLILRLQEILEQERQQLIWGKVWRNAVAIKRQGKEILNKIRRDRAFPIIEQYQWVAAATAFANPVSALDLLATAAINTQMVVDLSDIYQQKFTFSQGQAASTIIGKLMVQLGLVEVSTHAISGLLKSNAVTFVAGGATQGISAAYLTRVAGLSLIEYFQEQDVNVNPKQGIELEVFSKKLKAVFERTKRAEILQSFVRQAIPRLS
ncbi:MAG: DUF697 domain-containing protein, partial [Cyanobacteria bacterium P01_G01_bin.49]